MKTVNHTKRKQSAGKNFLAAGMVLLLLWLTSINFVIYSGNFGKGLQQSALVCTGEEESSESYPCNPAGPDEKAPGGPVSIAEEYIHESEHHTNPFWINALFQHKIHEAENTRIVHFELLSPPPEA